MTERPSPTRARTDHPVPEPRLYMPAMPPLWLIAWIERRLAHCRRAWRRRLESEDAEA